MIKSVIKYLIRFKLKNGNTVYFTDDQKNFTTPYPCEAKKYDTKDGANTDAMRMIGLPKVVQHRFNQEVQS